MLSRLQSLLGALFRRRRLEQDMTDEMEFHIQACADNLAASGVPRAEAMRRARAAFGGVDAAKEAGRAARGLRLIDELRQDLQFAGRQMRRAPGVTVAVVASLALGIGANTAIFSLMDAVLFRTLPVADPERLRFLAHTAMRQTTSSNYPLYERYQASGAFEGVTTYDRQDMTLTTPDGPERLNGQFVSGNYHAVLGVPMAHGRGFSNEVDRDPGASMLAVISDAYWSRQYGRSPDVLGRRLAMGGRELTIVGVTAAGFDGLIPGHKIDITVPVSVRAIGNAGYFDARDTWRSLQLVARLRDTETEPRALAVMDRTFKQFWAEPENAWARGPRSVANPAAVLLPAGRGADLLRRQYTVPLRVLMGMVGLVLIIACANVANLLLARATARAKEVAVRLSIGASRGRLVRQFLTESMILACAGGGLGFLVAIAGARFIATLLVTGRSPVIVDIGVNGTVLLFALGVSVATGIGFGLAPALRATRIALTPTLKEGGVVGPSRRRMSAGKTLVVAQVALCALVMSVAGLLAHTLTNLTGFDAGFARENMLLFNLEAPPELAVPARLTFYEEVRGRLHSLPGVAAVAYSARSPVDLSMNTRPFQVPGAPAGPNDGVSANIVTSGYFDLFGIPVLRGRGLAQEDRAASRPVAVINETVARQFFGDADPLGRTVLLGADKNRLEVVGVVRNVREELRELPPPAIYTPVAQTPVDADGGGGIPRRVTVEMLTTGNPAGQAVAVRREVRLVNRVAVLTYLRTMEQQVNAAIVRERILASVSVGFGMLAVLLAAVGLYGTMSYGVARRSREIGLRIALGATQSAMRWRVVRETVLLSVAGVVIGLATALATTRVVSSFLFGLSPRDPATLAGVAAILLSIGLAAGYFPGKRAAAVDPMVELRAE